MSEPEGWDGAVVAGARQAHRTALAAATAAVAVIEAETNASRYRLQRSVTGGFRACPGR